MNMETKLDAILAGRKTCTLGFFRVAGETGEQIKFGLTGSRLYGIKPTYNGKGGKGGGFDGQRWALGDFLKHNFGDEWGQLQPGVTLCIRLPGYSVDLSQLDLSSREYSWKETPEQAEQANG